MYLNDKSIKKKVGLCELITSECILCKMLLIYFFCLFFEFKNIEIHIYPQYNLKIYRKIIWMINYLPVSFNTHAQPVHEPLAEVNKYKKIRCILIIKYVPTFKFLDSF